MNTLSKYEKNYFPTILDEFVSRFFDDGLLNYGSRYGVEPLENGDYEVSLPLAGFKESDINITVENNTLTIEAKNQRLGNVYKTITLGQRFDVDKITSKFENGLLTVLLPRTEAAKPKKIKVN